MNESQKHNIEQKKPNIKNTYAKLLPKIMNGNRIQSVGFDWKGSRRNVWSG